MDKTGEGNSVGGNQWQRLLRWHRGQKVNQEGEDGAKDEGKHKTILGLKLKVK